MMMLMRLIKVGRDDDDDGDVPRDGQSPRPRRCARRWPSRRNDDSADDAVPCRRPAPRHCDRRCHASASGTNGTGPAQRISAIRATRYEREARRAHCG